MGIVNPGHRVTEAERLEFLGLLNRIDGYLRSYNSSGVVGAIMHEVWEASAKGREWDVTSLAVRLSIPRQTASRWVRGLEQEGWLKRDPQSKRGYLRPTDAFFKSAVPALDELLLHTRAVILDLVKCSK